MALADAPQEKRLGRRCDLGCESWPDEMIYSKCPVCGEPTTRFRNLTPLSDDEAQSKLLHAQFEEFYTRYCLAQGQTVDGPLA